MVVVATVEIFDVQGDSATRCEGLQHMLQHLARYLTDHLPERGRERGEGCSLVSALKMENSSCACRFIAYVP